MSKDLNPHTPDIHSCDYVIYVLHKLVISERADGSFSLSRY